MVIAMCGNRAKLARRVRVASPVSPAVVVFAQDVLVQGDALMLIVLSQC